MIKEDRLQFQVKSIASNKSPTKNQLKTVEKLIKHLGRDYVINYITNIKGYKNTDIDNLNRRQVQKIITGLGLKLPSKPIMNVYGRDVY